MCELLYIENNYFFLIYHYIIIIRYVEAEIAKGERRSGRSSPKRRDRDRRDRESGDAKRQRMDEMGDYMPAGIQPAMGFGGMPQPSLANVGAMGHMGRPSMAMQGSVQVPIVNVPIYIMSGDVRCVPNHLSDQDIIFTCAHTDNK